MSKEIAQCEVRSTESTEDIDRETWSALPTETEIYILPSGEIVVADLPVELIDLITELDFNLPSESASLPATD